MAGWDDVNRIDLRPGRGMAKVWLRNGWEVQVDLGSGRVLQAAYRRSDLIESLHDGSFFAGDLSRLGIFVPAGLCLLLMWVTGLWMFGCPFLPDGAEGRRGKVGEGARLTLGPSGASFKRKDMGDQTWDRRLTSG